MITEHLTVSIPRDTADAFLAADAEIWTATLSQQPGYIGKETCIDRQDPTRIHLFIRWETYEDWKAVPQDILADADARMTVRFGHQVPVLSCVELVHLG